MDPGRPENKQGHCVVWHYGSVRQRVTSRGQEQDGRPRVAHATHDEEGSSASIFRGCEATHQLPRACKLY